ncbi:proliferation marker protein Ki-67 [Scomber scombrus]|uniref:proliferation marker protein Ki-67 n=1 Tax=Scomber scombrus TaxID=13677 RepID=UPI002DD8B18B|nr:proliferation marker protein Ki-67 [Scomber scombrus]
MPLHGKIVVVKRSGVDGTEFPLTATCLFGRKPTCDIRIQLPQVSKEHCRIDFNENKEVILTNLSSVNPTRVNGEALQQSERLKHGDVITIIDRSFRFEYPPAPTPKKRSSVGGKSETLKVLQDQHVGDTVAVGTGEKRISEVSTDPHLKDGTNHDNIQRALEKTVAVESKEDDSLLQSKTNSPFNDLYQMIKKSLDVKTPRKSSSSKFQTPSSKFCTPKHGTVGEINETPAMSTEDTPKKDEANVSLVAGEMNGEAQSISNGTPKSVKKQRRSSQVPATEMVRPVVEEADNAKLEAITPQKFTVSEVIEQISAETPKSPMRRRSKEATPAKEQEQATPAQKTEHLRRTSPRNSGKVEKVEELSKKRKSGELAADLPKQKMKKKRVSFGGYLSPELFDKKLPPDSPLRKGAAPRRSLCLIKPKISLLRRASVIGLDFEEHPPGKKSPKSRSPSAKAASPGKKSPKSKASSPKAQSPGKKSPNSKSSSATGRSPSKNKLETPTAKRRSSLTPQENTATVVTPTKTPLSSQVNTPSVQGRFSVSRINTPSPVVEDAGMDPVSTLTVTPKIPLRRKSMKSTSRKTPSLAKSAVKVMHRRSGISRASMKALNSWADIVKFGQTKVQVAPPAKKTVNKKPVKKTVPKPQTPARKLISNASTGHANSPVTIVVGRAHKQKVVHPTGNAPRVVTNTALFQKNMKMDEDLTGVSEMFKTPANERKRRSEINEDSAPKTPVENLSTSVVEPSVLNTPEELGEMIVSPLNVASIVKERRYNSEAVQRLLNGDEESNSVSDTSTLEIHTDESGEQQCMDLKTTSVTTPKQKPELSECLTGVKRIMKTPRPKSEPLEDIRGKLLKTPKQKPEQQECLTGVKRIMKTPRQKSEPLEDIRGNLLKTPKQKPEQQECLSGVKRIMKTPEPEAEPLEHVHEELLKTAQVADVTCDAVKELEIPAHVEESENLPEKTDMETPNLKSSPVATEVEDQTRPDCGSDIAKELDFAHEEQQDVVPCAQSEEGPSDVIQDVPQVDVANGDENEVVCAQLEVPSALDANEPSDIKETISQAAVDKILPEEQLQAETATSEVTEMHATATDDEKKPVQGRRATTVESKAAEDKQEATENSEDPIVPTPARGRRGKKTEETAPSAVKQTTRNRNAKSTESKDAELTQEESAPLPSKVATKPKRGRNAKKNPDQAETVQEVATEMVPEPESEQITPVEHAAYDSGAPLEKPAVKPKRGRKTKQESEQSQSVPEQQDVPSTHSEQVDKAKEADVKEVSSEQLAVVPVEGDESKSSDAVETVTEMVQKKPVRGRKAKLVEPKAAEDNQEAAEPCEDLPVRGGRRGKRTAATAPPAVRKTTRGRNAKSQDISDDQPEILPEKAEETNPLPEISPEATPEETPINTSQEEIESAAPEMEVVSKPSRGRKAKHTPVEPPQSEPEKSEIVSDKHLLAADEPQKSAPTQRRGRKRNPDTVDQNEVTEDTVVAVETKKPSKPPVRAKRGRNAKQEEETVENDSKTTSVETTKSQEPGKKSRRTRKAEQDHVKPEEEEVQTVETLVPEEAEVPLAAKPVKMNEQATVPAKPVRGGRRAKQDTESVTPVKSTETQEVLVVSTTEKPKRGRRGKQVAEEVNITAEVPEGKPDHEPETEENQENVAAVKTSRARGAKTAKSEISLAVPAKRARRGAAPSHEETSTEAAATASESAPISVEPVKRGRRAAAKPTSDEATVRSDQVKLTEDLSSAAVEDKKTSKKSVKWKGDLNVHEITPLKAVCGKKSKSGGQDDTESNNAAQSANETEEKDLSVKVVESQPAKRARRVAKVTDVTTESTSKVNPKKDDIKQVVEVETPPKTRRGRSAKK